MVYDDDANHYQCDETNSPRVHRLVESENAAPVCCVARIDNGSCPDI